MIIYYARYLYALSALCGKNYFRCLSKKLPTLFSYALPAAARVAPWSALGIIQSSFGSPAAAKSSRPLSAGISVSPSPAMMNTGAGDMSLIALIGDTLSIPV